MLRSIRTKLALSYAGIVFLCLLLAGTGAVILIARYQRQSVLTRRRTVAAAVTQQVQGLMALEVRLADMSLLLAQEARRLGARFILIGSDRTVLSDTLENSRWVGMVLQIPASRLPLIGSGPSVVGYRNQDEGRQYLIVSYLRRPADSSAYPNPPSYVVVAVPEVEVRAPWREIASPLVIAGLLSLLVSVVAAALLSRSVTQPLVAMTRASEAIAQGDFQQVIASTGQDEVARLADSFNRMTREVERSRLAQRDFVANVSHDLKTPLTSIQGFAQAMLEGAVHDQEGYRRAAEIISEEAARMGQMVQNLLDLARLDAGRSKQDRQPIVPRDLVERCRLKMAPCATEAGLSLRVVVADGLPTVWGNPDRLEQALSNLVDNALKYTARGGRVEVAVQGLDVKGGRPAGVVPCPGFTVPPVVRDGKWIAFVVRDTGIGIGQEDLPHIFERFYRADKSRSGTVGSGLGLAIAREIARSHGGDITVNSVPGKGSCFAVLLPSGK